MTSGQSFAQAKTLSDPGSPRASITTTLSKAAHHAASMPSHYTVRSGDSLSAIAGRVYRNPALWPALWWINKASVRNPNEIEVGQDLKLSQWHPLTTWLAGAAMRAVPPPPPPPQPVRAVVSYAAPAQPAYQQPSGRSSGRHSYQAPAYSGSSSSGGSYSGGTPGGSFGQCVVARESGGNAQVMNSSGHYGLYQFSEGTWVAYGGSAADFGHASPGEQEQVFGNAIAQGGQSNWAPYDGC